jgi:hypothetical protein
VLSKIRLEKGKKFEISLATYKVALMLTKFIDGLSHDLSLGSEDAGIKHWDDFLIETDVDQWEHIQVKRQETPFSEKKVIRGKTKKKDKTLVDDELSEFDLSLRSLVDWLRTADAKISMIKRKFIFEISSLDTAVKRTLPIRKFKELSKVVKPTTTVAQLQAMAAKDQSVNIIYNYLVSWCGINGWDEMLDFFKAISFAQNGDEDDLDQRSFDLLSSYFSSVGDVILRIKNLIDEESTFPNKLTPRAVYCKVVDRLLPGKKKWTQFRKLENKWEVSGIHDPISDENARQVVNQVWSDTHNSELKVDVPVAFAGVLGDAILRMGLHFSSSSGFHTTNCGAWKEAAKLKVGETLGNEEDMDSFVLFNYSSFLPSEPRHLIGGVITHSETDELHDQMDQISWNLLVEKLDMKIDHMVNGKIRSLVEKRWFMWKEHLSNNKTDRNEFIHSSMRPMAESLNVLSRLRVGKKTVSVIANAMYLLLIVSICVSTDDDYSKVKECNVSSYALTHWSGPSETMSQVRKISDHGIADLMGKETAAILILAGTDAPISAIRSTPLSGLNDSLDLSAPNRPKIVITAIAYLENLVRNDLFEELQAYIIKQQKGQESDVTNKINSLTN